MVDLSIRNTKRNFLTAKEGNFVFRNLPPGTYELEVSMVGHETTLQQVKVEIKQNDRGIHRLQLSNKQLRKLLLNQNTY